MGAAGIWLDMATAMIAGIAVGVAVDDTIHVFDGFQRRVRSGVSPVMALVRTYRSAGRAVITTSVILCVQFLVLMSSSFVPTRNFGLLTAIGLVAALGFDLLLLPALLIVFYGKKNPLRARWPRLFASNRKDIAVAETTLVEPDLDEAYWTTARKVALVHEILGGKHDVASVAREYAVPEGVVEGWLASAERAISESLESEPESRKRKLQAIAEGYRRLKEEKGHLRDIHRNHDS
jgi:hypothetical protein